MTVRLFETFIEISRLQNELNKLFNDLIEAQRKEASRFAGEIVPEVDIFETQQNLILKIDVPGVKKEDINLSMTANNLLISGIKKRMEISTNKIKFHCLERIYGHFKRSIHIDVPIDKNNIKAWLESGLLTVIFNKIQEKSKIEIPIEIGEKSN
jgi:HSP20 family protein